VPFQQLKTRNTEDLDTVVLSVKSFETLPNFYQKLRVAYLRRHQSLGIALSDYTKELLI
jgi:GTP1/Obg family GTP-binding protein